MLNPLETYRCNHCGRAGRPRFSVALLLIAAVLIALAIIFAWGALHLPMRLSTGSWPRRGNAGSMESGFFAVIFGVGAWHLLRQSKQHCGYCGFDFK